MKQNNDKKRNAGTKAVSWDEVHRRLNVVWSSLQHGREITPEMRKEILRARARALSQKPRAEDKTRDFLEVLEFQLANERYGIETSFVREVYPLKELAPVPCTPPFVLGVVNVRGKIISVLEMKKFFDLPEKGLTELNKAIILHSENVEFAILADVVLGVRNISATTLQPPLPTLTGIREEYLKGVTENGLIILNTLRFLSDKKLIVHEDVEN